MDCLIINIRNQSTRKTNLLNFNYFPGVKEGWLTVKVASIEGKKATDRSWKTVYVVLKTHAMLMYKDKKVATEVTLLINFAIKISFIESEKSKRWPNE